MRWVAMLGWLLLAARSLMAQTPLSAAELLQSMERHYPPLLVALEEQAVADGELTQALGAFDLQLALQADADRFGYYENERLNVGVEQPFAWQGLSAYGGWRVGDGKFAPYDGKLDTRGGGEWRGGWKIPLFRNRAIDGRRAGLQRAEIGRRLAQLSIDQQRLLIRQIALRRYWDWVAAGQRLRIANDVLDVALQRDRALRESVDLGQIPSIEARENERQILQRRAQTVEAQRGIELAAIELSLFYRDDSGQPRRADPAQLPKQLPNSEDIEDQKLADDLAIALAKRPEIERLAAQQEQVQIDLALAENEMLPTLDLGLGFTTETGGGSVQRGPTDAKASLRFDLPLQRRAATGKRMAAEAKLRQVVQRAQFARDQVEAEVRDAASAVRAAHRRHALAAEEVSVAIDLAAAERDRFRLGDSTLFLVNLREQAAVDAELRQVAALNDYLRSLVAYEQATAQLLP